MISYPIYNFIHILGIVAVTFSLGLSLISLYGIPRPKGMMALQGIGLFLILLGGFGMAARLGMVRDFPTWIQLKISFWVLLGLLLLDHRFLKLKMGWVVAAQVVFLILGASFGIFKPV